MRKKFPKPCYFRFCHFEKIKLLKIHILTMLFQIIVHTQVVPVSEGYGRLHIFNFSKKAFYSNKQYNLTKISKTLLFGHLKISKTRLFLHKLAQKVQNCLIFKIMTSGRQRCTKFSLLCKIGQIK